MMITAYGDQGNRSTAERLGADAFLTKPLDFYELKNKLISLS
jgi:DNA-binding response OmpR family regulator